MVQQVIGILFPVLALVLVGFSVGRWLKPDFRPINRINMDTFTPALVFSSLISMPLDTEQIPLLEEGGIEAFIQREVLPHVPDAWVDEKRTIVGYEIPFTRHFYKYEPLRSLEEIAADIRSLEDETEGLLEQITGGVA